MHHFSAGSISESALRWQSRRGLLELDLTLQKFWGESAGNLSAGDLRALAALLSLGDEDLWRIVAGEEIDMGDLVAAGADRDAIDGIIHRLRRL